MPWEIEIDDVVAGQPIESAWGNEIRDKIVHTVATVATLPSGVDDGGLAYVEATDETYLRRSGVWIPTKRPLMQSEIGTTWTAPSLGTWVQCVAVTFPTIPLAAVTMNVSASVMFNTGAGAPSMLTIWRASVDFGAGYVAENPGAATARNVSINAAQRYGVVTWRTFLAGVLTAPPKVKIEAQQATGTLALIGIGGLVSAEVVY
jgi:hypothetical protein